MQLGAGRHHDERQAHLAEARVGHPHHRHPADRGVGEEQVLDLGRVRVEAADDEHVFLAPDDAEAAALVERAEVAGVQPTIGVDRACRLRRVVEVAPHHAVAPDQHLARLSQRLRLAVVVGDADLEAGTGPTDGGGDGLEVVVGAGAGDACRLRSSP